MTLYVQCIVPGSNKPRLVYIYYKSCIAVLLVLMQHAHARQALGFVHMQSFFYVSRLSAVLAGTTASGIVVVQSPCALAHG